MEDPSINCILSADCLRLIFKQLTLREQLQLRLVCSNWNTIIEHFFRSIRMLYLYGNQSDVTAVHCGMKHYKVHDTPELKTVLAAMGLNLKDVFQSLHYNEFILNKDDASVLRACEVMPKLFPNVNVLLIFCEQLFKEEMSEMLSSWSATLNGLLIFKLPSSPPATFWPTVSSLPHLDRLHLVRMYNNMYLPNSLGVLPKLKHFFLTHYLADMVPILGQLTSVENIKLAMVILSLAQLEAAIKLNPAIVVNLRWLQLGIISSPPNVNRYTNLEQVLNLFSSKFKNIFFLDLLMADQLPLTTLIPILAQLTSLSTLWLYVGRHQLSPSTRQLYSLPRLPAVNSLYIEIYDLSVEQFCLWIGGLFPNLNTLTVKIDPEFSEKNRFRKNVLQEFRQLEKLTIIDHL